MRQRKSDGPKKLRFVSDFETTTTEDDCRVWGWGIADIDSAQTVGDVRVGQDIKSFLEIMEKQSSVVYFHNLKFDGRFILDYLLKHDFHYRADGLRRGEFSTLISKMGQFYSITVKWRNGRKTEFRDSLKKLPMGVKALAEAFDLEVAKGEIDYHSPRPVGHVITPEERHYIALDVLIVAKALKVQFDTGMEKLTVGSDSLHEYKEILGARRWSRMFPILSETMDNDIRTAYRGGFTYADKRFMGKRVGAGQTYDVNSLYPSVMYDRLLPWGEPLYVNGYPETDEDFPLFITSITFTAKLKKDHIPCIQVKGSSRFVAVDYQENIEEPVTMHITNVDLALWQQQYDLNIISWNGSWLFRGATGLFCEFIDKWMEVKATSTGGLRALAKLQLNSLYGKFASNPNVTGKYPYLDENGVVRLKVGPEETKSPVYTAMGVFITAYARDVTIRAAQDNYEHFAYADTDSLHLLTDTPIGLEIDPHKLGAWKHEYDFQEAIFVRPKAYIERVGFHHCKAVKKDPAHVHVPSCEYETHIAGLERSIATSLTFSDIVDKAKFKKKVPKAVPGGIILTEVDFTLNVW